MNQPRVALCASCDRCRARKTKCDGKRPCGNCANKYMKKHRLTSIEGIDLSLFECVYSPAKRRGPVPGKASQSRKADEMDARGGPGVGSSSSVKGKSSNLMRMDMGMGSFGNVGAGGSVFNQQQAQLAALMGNGNGGGLDGSMGGLNQNLPVGMSDPLAIQQQLMLQQQQLRMQQGMGMDSSGIMGSGSFDNMGQQNLLLQQQLLMQQMQQIQQQQKSMAAGVASLSGSGAGTAAGTEDASISQQNTQLSRTEEGPPANVGVDTSVTKNLGLLEKSSVDGNRLRSHYTLSIDTLFKLPPVSSDEEYCAKLNANMTPSMLPPFDVAALRAARFAEIALGALVSNQIALALELSSATVVCLKQCVEDPVHPSCMFDVAKAYFLHGMFRSYRGDMKRYFKYRRVCLSKLSHLNSDVRGIQQILAAISFHDSWAYMLYNASENKLPDIDDDIPKVSSSGKSDFSTNVEKKYQVSVDHTEIAGNPKNQMWVQGPPPVFINNEAPPLSRALDALACAIRSCCDEANDRLDKSTDGNGTDASCPPSVTSLAVTSNEKELCSRNLVLSAFTLIQQSEDSNGIEKNHGHHLLVNAMDAFLEAGDDEEVGGFTDSQIQSLLSVCNTITDFPYLLYQGGPTYFMMCNVAIMVCHFLNGFYAKELETGLGEMETALFEEALDSYLAVRKLLNSHRRKLPGLLRCHVLPGVNLLQISRSENGDGSAPLIDIGQTQMCATRGCQTFVLMGCSPIVAAERAQAAQLNYEDELATSNREMQTADDLGAEFDPSLIDLARELDVDDDALLSILGKIVTA